MASIAKLVVSLGANTASFETDMKRAGKITEREMRKMERQAKRLNDQWNRQFKAAGLAAVGAFALATKAAIDFEKAMAEVSTLLDDTSSMDGLAESVKNLSVEFGQAPVDQAKALYQIISAGASTAAEQMENLTVANKLAVGGVTDVATAADGLTTVLNAYAGTGLDVNRISDILFQTMKSGKTTIGELSSSIGNVATIAAQTGVSFDEIGAAVGTLTKAGINTSQSMDALRGVLSAVLKQSDQSVKMAQELGVEFNATALEAKGLYKFLSDIAATGATSEQLSKLFGRVEGLNAVMALGAQDAAEFTAQLEGMGDIAGITEEAVAKMADTTAMKVAQAQAAFQVLGIEIGQRFLASVSGLATTFVANLDEIIIAIENLLALLVGRLAVAGVAAFAAAASAAGGLATAMAIMGGPVGIVVAGISLLIINLDRLQAAEGPVGDFIRLMSRGFTMLAGVLGFVQAEILNLVQIFYNTLRGIVAPATAVIRGLAGAIAAALDQDFKGAVESLSGILQGFEKEFDNATTAVDEGLEKIGDGAKYLEAAWEKSANMFNQADAAVSDVTTTIAAAKPKIEATAKSTEKLGDAAKDTAKGWDALSAAQKKAVGAFTGMNAAAEAQQEMMRELRRQQDEYERSLENILDTLYPVEAAGRAFGEALDTLTQAYQNGDISAERYEQSVSKLTEKFNEQVGSIRNVATEFDLMTTLVDEGARILQRTFTGIWDGLLEGSGKAFDAVKDGFKAMMANIANQAITQPIVVNIQQGLAGTGAGPNGGIDFAALGTDLAAFGAVIAGTKLGGDSQAAAIGATLGAIGGSFIPGVGNVIGTIAGGIIGGIVGGLFNKVFGKNKTPRIEIGTGFDIKTGDSQFFNTAFGQTSVGNTRGGMDDYVQDFGNALTAFDDSIADFLSDDQIGKITESLDGWSASLRGKSITIEDLLNRRFAWIMSTFSDTIQNFVADGEDLAAKADRLQVAVSAETLIADNPDLFGDRVLGDFLQIVEAFKSGNETIAEAYNEVLELLNIIGPVYESLQSFRDSNLGDDFAAIIAGADATLQEALTGLVSGLDDAIRNFDGSPEELQRIGAIVASIREGELKLLAEIDGIQRGISANLAQLKSDLLGIGAEPLTGEQLFNQAAGLIGQLGSASTAQEVAEIARQFEATIRQLSPEDQARNASELVRMVDDFDKAQNAVLESMKQAVIDSAADTRAMIDTFIERIGTPLDILVGSNQEVADALGDGGAFEQMTIDNQDHQNNMETILETGVEDIAGAVGSIGPTVAGAVQRALAGTDINVQVVVNGGLVTQ